MSLASDGVFFELCCADRDLFNYLFRRTQKVMVHYDLVRVPIYMWPSPENPVPHCFCMNWNENFWGCIRDGQHCDNCTNTRWYQLCNDETEVFKFNFLG